MLRTRFETPSDFFFELILVVSPAASPGWPLAHIFDVFPKPAFAFFWCFVCAGCLGYFAANLLVVLLWWTWALLVMLCQRHVAWNVTSSDVVWVWLLLSLFHFCFCTWYPKCIFLVVAAYASRGRLCPYTMQRFFLLDSLRSLISPFLFPKENEVLFECPPMTVEVCLLFLFALLSCCFYWPCFCPPVALLNRFCPLRFLDPLSSFLFLFCFHTCVLAAFVLICSHPICRILSLSSFPFLYWACLFDVLSDFIAQCYRMESFFACRAYCQDNIGSCN